MKSIPSRIIHCKNRPDTCAKTQESEKIANDIAEFLKSGGKITKIKTGAFNFMNDLEKGNKKKNKYFHIDKSTYNKKEKPTLVRENKTLDISAYQHLADDAIIDTKSMMVALGVSSNASVVNYVSRGLIPQPKKLSNLCERRVKAAQRVEKYKSAQKVRNYKNKNYWILGELRKHNKELSK